MFDWNDEELGNIIWDDVGEDHIVPHSDGNKDDCSKKGWKGEVAATKASAQKTLEVKHGFSDLKLKSTSNFGEHGNSSSAGLSTESWPDRSPDFVKTGQESKNSKVADDVLDTKHYLAKGEEHNDFVGYEWGDIGSFDDLDRIFGNDVTLFGGILGNADKQWSSKDVTDSSVRSFSRSGSTTLGSEDLTDTPQILQVKPKIWQLQGSESFHYPNISSSYFYNPTFRNVAAPYSVNPLNKQDSPSKPTMTSQEKIEKLKQQDQFTQQDENSISERTEFNLDDSSVHTSSAVEQDDSDSGVVIHYAAEEIVLSRLHDVIAKLDSRIRLCIRDSLFRLAKSAVQRHCAGVNNNTSTTRIKDEDTVAKEDTGSNNRVAKMLDGETETNPIDRMVAHLLFHRPLDSTINHFSTPPSIHPKLPPPENNRPKIPSLCKNADFVDGGF